MRHDALYTMRLGARELSVWGPVGGYAAYEPREVRVCAAWGAHTLTPARACIPTRIRPRLLTSIYIRAHRRHARHDMRHAQHTAIVRYTRNEQRRMHNAQRTPYNETHTPHDTQCKARRALRFARTTQRTTHNARDESTTQYAICNMLHAIRIMHYALRITHYA